MKNQEIWMGLSHIYMYLFQIKILQNNTWFKHIVSFEWKYNLILKKYESFSFLKKSEK